MTKLLAFMIFTSSCVSAYCLGLLAYTLATGDLPFGMVAMTAVPDEVKKKKNGPRIRQFERYAEELFDSLVEERRQMAEERGKLEERRRVVEELAKNAKQLQAEVKESASKLNALVSSIDEQEMANSKRLAKLVGDMEGKAGSEFVYAMEEKMAGRVLYLMDQKKAAQLLSALLKQGASEKREWAAKMAKEMQRLSSDMP